MVGGTGLEPVTHACEAALYNRQKAEYFLRLNSFDPADICDILDNYTLLA